MKKVLSSIIAALVALSFFAAVFADAAAPAVEKKDVKKAKKVKNTEEKKYEAAPAAK